jgi:hypothetical protein
VSAGEKAAVAAVSERYRGDNVFGVNALRRTALARSLLAGQTTCGIFDKRKAREKWTQVVAQREFGRDR